MKRLTLMRHADARWKDVGLSDFARPLSRRGTNAAQAMARRLRELELVPDLVLVSPARRARQTAEIVARELSLPAARLLREGGLYLAGAAELLRIAAGQRTANRTSDDNRSQPGALGAGGASGARGAGRYLATAAVCSMTFGCRGVD